MTQTLEEMRRPVGGAMTAYGIIYGAEGCDYPDVSEDGPYATLSDARAAVDLTTAARMGGWTIVSDYSPSDGESISTGAGIVVENDSQVAR